VASNTHTKGSGVNAKPLDLAIIIAVIIGAIQILLSILQVYLQASTMLRISLYIVMIVITGSLILWLGQQYQSMRRRIVWLWLMCVAISLPIFVATSGYSFDHLLTALLPSPSTTTYYLKVVVYSDDNGDGLMDGLEQPLPGIRVTSINVYGRSAFFTTKDGTALFEFPNQGRVVLQVCGVSESHYVPPIATDPALAATVQIGLVCHTPQCCS
jgi:hypothetical protein